MEMSMCRHVAVRAELTKNFFCFRFRESEDLGLRQSNGLDPTAGREADEKLDTPRKGVGPENSP